MIEKQKDSAKDVAKKARGERIREAREAASLTKAAVARILGIPYSTYDGYESGHRAPSIDMMEELADILSADVNYLMHGQTLQERDEAYARRLGRSISVDKATTTLYEAYGFTMRSDGDAWIITDPDGNASIFLGHRQRVAYGDITVKGLKEYALFLHQKAVKDVLGENKEEK